MVYHVYIMASQSGVLYIGMTNDLSHRVSQHKSKTIPGFSQTYNTAKLIYFEPFQDVRNAIAREKQLKRWNRSKKIFLIEKQNPTWQDLYPALIPTTPAPISTTSETCHPDRSNPTFSSHLTSCEMVGLRSGGTSPFFSFHEGCPRLGSAAWVLGLPVPLGSRPDRSREMGKIARINARKKFCSNDVIPIYERYYKRILSES